MKLVQVKNLTKGTVVLEEAILADSFYLRLRGLLGRESLAYGMGIVLTPCSSVHMVGMKFSLDVIFVDRNHQICHVIESLKPYRLSPHIKQAQMVLEGAEGMIAHSKSRIGDHIEISALS